VTPTARYEERHRRGGLSWTARIGVALFCLCAVFALHATLITLPPGEDEMATFLPAARQAADVPASVREAPSPVLAITAGIVDRIAGEGVWPQRAGMLVWAAAVLYYSFLAAVELCGSLPGLPAVYAVLLLGLSPLFYMQSVLVHPELPAMAALAAALYFFLSERQPWGAAAGAVAAFCLPAGVWVPLAIGGWLLFERRFRRALPYLAAGSAGAAFWILREGAPAQAPGISASVFHTLRLLYFLFIGHGHWIAVLGLLIAWREELLARRRWRAALLMAAGFAVIQMFPGRMQPERALMPVLPVLYTGATAGLFALPAGRRWLGYSALAALLTAGHFINPLLWPFRYENNLTFAEDARLRRQAAEWMETYAPQAMAVTAGPMALALQDPRWGYVRQPLRVLTLPAFDQDFVKDAAAVRPDAFILYSQEWDPPANLLRRREFSWAATRFLGLRTPLDADSIEPVLGLKRAAFLRVGSQWAEIYTRSGPPTVTP
jgi:hypothetical protein